MLARSGLERNLSNDSIKVTIHVRQFLVCLDSPIVKVIQTDTGQPSYRIEDNITSGQ